MILGIRPLNAVANVNTFEYTNTFQFTESDGPALYFQLIDSTLDSPTQGFSPSGRRYCPIVGATLQCTVVSIDTAKTVTRFASQAFTTDTSIWKLQLQSTDTIRGTADLKLVLTESGQITRGTAPRIILAIPLVG